MLLEGFREEIELLVENCNLGRGTCPDDPDTISTKSLHRSKENYARVTYNIHICRYTIQREPNQKFEMKNIQKLWSRK